MFPNLLGTRHNSPVLDIDTDGAEVPGKEPAVDLLVREIAHAPAAFVVHDEERPLLLLGRRQRRRRYRGVDTDPNLGAAAHPDLPVLLGHLVGDRARDVAHWTLIIYVSAQFIGQYMSR